MSLRLKYAEDLLRLLNSRRSTLLPLYPDPLFQTPVEQFLMNDRPLDDLVQYLKGNFCQQDLILMTESSSNKRNEYNYVSRKFDDSIDEFGRNQFLQLLECFLRNNQEKVLADYYTHCHIHLRETQDQYFLYVFLIKKYVTVDSIQIKFTNATIYCWTQHLQAQVQGITVQNDDQQQIFGAKCVKQHHQLENGFTLFKISFTSHLASSITALKRYGFEQARVTLYTGQGAELEDISYQEIPQGWFPLIQTELSEQTSFLENSPYESLGERIFSIFQSWNRNSFGRRSHRGKENNNQQPQHIGTRRKSRTREGYFPQVELTPIQEHPLENQPSSIKPLRQRQSTGLESMTKGIMAKYGLNIDESPEVKMDLQDKLNNHNLFDSGVASRIQRINTDTSFPTMDASAVSRLFVDETKTISQQIPFQSRILQPIEIKNHPDVRASSGQERKPWFKPNQEQNVFQNQSNSQNIFGNLKNQQTHSLFSQKNQEKLNPFKTPSDNSYQTSNIFNQTSAQPLTQNRTEYQQPIFQQQLFTQQSVQQPQQQLHQLTLPQPQQNQNLFQQENNRNNIFNYQIDQKENVSQQYFNNQQQGPSQNIFQQPQQNVYPQQNTLFSSNNVFNQAQPQQYLPQQQQNPLPQQDVLINPYVQQMYLNYQQQLEQYYRFQEYQQILQQQQQQIYYQQQYQQQNLTQQPDQVYSQEIQSQEQQQIPNQIQQSNTQDQSKQEQLRNDLSRLSLSNSPKLSPKEFRRSLKSSSEQSHKISYLEDIYFSNQKRASKSRPSISESILEVIKEELEPLEKNSKQSRLILPTTIANNIQKSPKIQSPVPRQPQKRLSLRYLKLQSSINQSQKALKDELLSIGGRILYNKTSYEPKYLGVEPSDFRCLMLHHAEKKMQQILDEVSQKRPMMNSFHLLYQDEKTSDIIVKLHNIQFKLHKVVLKQSSIYFSDILKQIQNQYHVIVLPDHFDGATFQYVIRFMYQQQLPSAVWMSLCLLQGKQMLKSAIWLKLIHFGEQILAKVIVPKINIESCVEWLELSEQQIQQNKEFQHIFTYLKRYLLKFFAYHADQIFQNENLKKQLFQLSILKSNEVIAECLSRYQTRDTINQIIQVLMTIIDASSLKDVCAFSQQKILYFKDSVERIDVSNIGHEFYLSGSQGQPFSLPKRVPDFKNQSLNQLFNTSKQNLIKKTPTYELNIDISQHKLNNSYIVSQCFFVDLTTFRFLLEIDGSGSVSLIFQETGQLAHNLKHINLRAEDDITLPERSTVDLISGLIKYEVSTGIEKLLAHGQLFHTFQTKSQNAATLQNIFSLSHTITDLKIRIWVELNYLHSTSLSLLISDLRNQIQDSGESLYSMTLRDLQTIQFVKGLGRNLKKEEIISLLSSSKYTPKPIIPPLKKYKKTRPPQIQVDHMSPQRNDIQLGCNLV